MRLKDQLSLKQKRINMINKLIPLILLFVIFSLSVGYSAFSSKINITGVVTNVTIKKDIRITSASEYTTSFCTVTSGDGTSVGDEITCGTESFYVVKNDGMTVKLLSKYNLNVGDTTYASGTIGIQNEKVIGYKSGKTLYGPVAFSGSDYWLSDSVLKSEYSSYYVYDSNSNLYQYVESYKKYLINKGMNVLETRLLREDEATELGCSGTSCTKAPDWVYSTNYWLGTLYSGNY